MEMFENTSYYVPSGVVYFSFIILMIIIMIIILFVYVKLKRNIKDVNKTNKKAQENLEDIDLQIHNIKDDNKEIVKLHKQINDKSETMSKILEQTTKIYREVLEKEVQTEAEGPMIDYHALNSKSEKPGKHLFELIDDINEGKSREKKPKKLSFNSLQPDDLNYLSLKELEDLYIQLEEYEYILKKEFQAYVKEIKKLNELNITPSKRLSQKEFMYKKMQEIEKKLDHQKKLLKSINLIKENKIVDFETKHKEHELDELINNMANRRK